MKMSPDMGGLPKIPVVDVGSAGLDRLVTVERERFEALYRAARSLFTPPGVRAANAMSRAWARSVELPYRHEIEAVDAAIGVPGAWLMNLNYEWGCTTAGVADPAGGNRLLRTLDWFQPGLGRTVVAARRSGPQGAWVALTWPGFVGVIQGLAPGRFAVAINQAPTGTRLTWPVGWVRRRIIVWRGRSLPPALLLRQVFDNCPSFAEARARLIETPVCLPVIFSLVGPEPGEGCIIERMPREAAVTDGLGAVTNHWLAGDFPAQSRLLLTCERLDAMRRRLDEGVGGFEWLVPPIVNSLTRLAFDANPRTGALRAQGFEGEEAVTEVLELMVA